MGPSGRRRLKRFLIAIFLAIASTTAAGSIFGALAGAMVGTIGFLGVAIAADDGVGTFFILAVLLTIIIVLILMGLTAAVLVNP